MDLQAAESKIEVKQDWACPCNGCAKAVKQERKRITEELNKIDLNSPAKLNGLGMKMLTLNIINPEKKKDK